MKKQQSTDRFLQNLIRLLVLCTIVVRVDVRLARRIRTTHVRRVSPRFRFALLSSSSTVALCTNSFNGAQTESQSVSIRRRNYRRYRRRLPIQPVHLCNLHSGRCYAGVSPSAVLMLVPITIVLCFNTVLSASNTGLFAAERFPKAADRKLL